MSTVKSPLQRSAGTAPRWKLARPENGAGGARVALRRRASKSNAPAPAQSVRLREIEIPARSSLTPTSNRARAPGRFLLTWSSRRVDPRRECNRSLAPGTSVPPSSRLSTEAQPRSRKNRVKSSGAEDDRVGVALLAVEFEAAAVGRGLERDRLPPRFAAGPQSRRSARRSDVERHPAELAEVGVDPRSRHRRRRHIERPRHPRGRRSTPARRDHRAVRIRRRRGSNSRCSPPA